VEQPKTRPAGTFGRLIKERREILGMSQQQLADLLITSAGKPVAVSQVSRWERLAGPGYLPKPRMLRQLAAALQIEQTVLIAAAHGEAVVEEGDSLATLASWQTALASMTDLRPEVSSFLESSIAQARRLEHSLRERAGD